MKRPYTGNKDGLAKGATLGIVALVEAISTYSSGACWNNGTFVNRPMRGKESLSVHATGRAADISWRKVGKKGKKDGRVSAEKIMEFLVEHAEALGLEMIIDYPIKPFGRAWRCDRNEWLKYDSETVHGGGNPASDWFHVEISPKMSSKPNEITKVFSDFFVFQEKTA